MEKNRSWTNNIRLIWVQSVFILASFAIAYHPVRCIDRACDYQNLNLCDAHSAGVERRPSHTNRQTPMRKRILLFGDSLTQQSFDDGGWGARLTSLFQRKVDIRCSKYASMRALNKRSGWCSNWRANFLQLVACPGWHHVERFQWV